MFRPGRFQKAPAGGRPAAGPLVSPLSLRKNLAWIFAGYVVYVACQWGMLVVLAKLGSPEMVGQFALGLAVTAPVILFANLGLRPFQATDAERHYDFGAYLGLRLVTTMLAAVVVLALAAWYGGETGLVVMAVGLAKCLEAVSDIFYGLLQQREQMDRFSKSIVARGLLSLAALAALVYLTGSVLWGALGMALSWALVLLVYDLRSGAMILGRLPRPLWDAGTLRKLVLLSFPLGISVVLASLNVNVPRLLVEHFQSTRELGIFAAMAYPVTAGATVVGALGQSASPRLAGYFVAGDVPAFRTLMVKLMALGGTLGVAGLLVAAVAGRELLTLVYAPEYARYLGVFLTLMLGAGVTYVASFLGFGLIATRRLRAQVPLLLCVVAVTAVASLLLIPAAGILGAAVASVLGACCQLIGGWALLWSTLRERDGQTA